MKNLLKTTGAENKEMTYTGIMSNELPASLAGTKVEQARSFISEIFGSVRIVIVDGKVMMVGKDVAECLGYKNTRDAINSHCKGVVKHDILTNGGIQEMTLITEYDVIRLVTKSRLPKAEEFEKWVFEELVPQTLATGGYIPIGEHDEEIDILKKSLEIAENTVKLMTQQLDNKELRIKRLENKSNAFEKLAINRDNMLLRDFLSEHNINMSDQSVFKKLTENGHIEKNEHNRYRKTEKLKEREATTGKEFFTLGGKNGDTLVVTPYGQAWLIHLCENKF